MLDLIIESEGPLEVPGDLAIEKFANELSGESLSRPEPPKNRSLVEVRRLDAFRKTKKVHG